MANPIVKRACLDGRRSLFPGLVFFAATGAMALAGDWPSWRGPKRDGHVDEASGWDGQRWIDAKPAWTARVGEGASSPLRIGEQVFVLGYGGGKDHVHCLDARTGQSKWVVSYAAREYGRKATGDEGLYSGPSSTPEFDPETAFLYTLGSDGTLNCWDTAKTGAIVWQRNLYDDFDAPQRPKVGRSGRRDYGYTTAPMLHRDWLLVEVGATQGTVIAFDKKTGKDVWTSEANGCAGHTGGFASLTLDGSPCASVLTFDGLLVVDLDPSRAGRTVATYPWVTDFANNIAGTAARDGCVLITSEYNHAAMCKLRVTRAGAEKLWETPYSSKACTPVIDGNRIYVAWHRLRCLDWETGKLLWEGPPVGDAGSIVLTADQKLVVWCHRGDLILVDVAPENPMDIRELARIPGLATSDVWPHVTLAGGQILCRDRVGNVMAFTIPK